MFTEFFTLEMLATFAGATMAVGVITEMFKKIGFFLNVPNQLISYVVAVIVMVVGNLALGNLTWSSAFLVIFNAAVVSLASNGGHDLVAAAKRKGEENEQRAAVAEMVKLEEQANSEN